MGTIELIAVVSIFSAAFAIAIGSIGSAFGEAMAASTALRSIAQQPDHTTAIYAFVVSMILIFANPFWDYVIQQAAGK